MGAGFFRDYVRVALILVLGLMILFVDFFTKSYVFNILSHYNQCMQVGGCLEIPIFKILGVSFSIGFAINKGAAWGLFSDFQFFLLIIRFLVILGMIVYLIFINRSRLAEIPLAIIIAGAIGNVVDYFLYGFVIDFLHFNLWGYDFPVFNIADSAITLGVIWLFIAAALEKKKSNEIATKV